MGTKGTERRPSIKTRDGFRLELAARQSALEKTLRRYEEFGRARRIPAAARRAGHLALDEIVSNIIRHGRGSRESRRISVAVTLDSGILIIKVVDNGAPFDPLAVVTPLARGSVLVRPSGGLGIRLVKALMDELRYRRRDRRNHLVMKRRLDG
ncbi:MAG TPA: ATP-binding protein [Vicinamibacterales bacterium]|jgi:anti-sigma regulatory factor (Ser/Thr protein kinase)|nr:ATP-binding protein [Vicinamibacterales bacterium]